MINLQTDAKMRADGEFLTLMQFLKTDSKYSRSVNMYVQDTVFFKNREPYLLVYN